MRKKATGATLLGAATLIAACAPGTTRPAPATVLVAPAAVPPQPTPEASRAPVDCKKRKCVALTFDDGPGRGTAGLLKTLKKANVRVTFFVVGPQARARKGVVARAHADGHEIGDHTETHPVLTKLTASRIRKEIGGARRTIISQTGVKPVLFRPPYGATNARVAAQARYYGLSQILWDVDTLDWRDRKASVVSKRAIRGFHRGAIILMHDIHPTTIAAVPAIIKAAKKKGYTLVTVSELLGKTKPGKVYTDARP